ncbi:hypothetical protein FS837_012503 [Tulasnella sp. UAMH 9824]|nr:hypothetical protein FS837_012503 [Tulasnella sp. UAMH 9824]
MLGETISELTYGAVKHYDGTDYLAEHAKHFAYSKQAAMGYLVDLFPLLRFIPSWFPGAKFKRDAQKWGQHAAELRKILAEGVEQRMASKEGRPCYVSSLLEDLRRLESDTGEDIREDMQAVLNSGFSFYQAGSDTTEVVLSNFLLAMTLYPEIQARAREEVDRIYGEGYPHDIEEQEKMPFTHAVFLESMRWNPPVSSGLAHALREDDIYEGYFIPKGTTVIGNLWYV